MKHAPRMPLTLILVAALTASIPAVADDPSAAGERHLYRFDATGVTAWLAESVVDLDPTDVVHMDMYEVTRMPWQFQATPEQRAAADALVTAAREAAERHGWYDFDRAVADGYEVMEGDTAHYANRDMLRDGEVFNVDHPEFLMYYDTDSGKKLAGFMFLVEEASAEGPQIGGPLTRWHFHVWHQAKCLLHGLLVVGDADADGECVEGIASHRSPEMIHVWLTDHPDGAFATKMHLEKWQIRNLESGHHHH